MVAVPAAMPETTPVDEPIDATDGLLELHEPPASESDKVMVEPAHNVVGPVIGSGNTFTFTVVVIKHPVETSVYEIYAIPVVPPVTMPVADPTVATDGLLLLQVPPGLASLNVIVVAEHNMPPPIIADGGGFTVIVVVTIPEQ